MKKKNLKDWVYEAIMADIYSGAYRPVRKSGTPEYPPIWLRSDETVSD